MNYVVSWVAETERKTLFHFRNRQWAAMAVNVDLRVNIHVLFSMDTCCVVLNSKTDLWNSLAKQGSGRLRKSETSYTVSLDYVNTSISPLYAYSRALVIVLISSSMLQAQFSASPISLSAPLKLSTRLTHCCVCLAKLVALWCSCLASASSLFWFK